MKKIITKRGPRVTKEELYRFLDQRCGGRALDDEEDLEAVVDELIYYFRMYSKVLVSRTP